MIKLQQIFLNALSVIKKNKTKNYAKYTKIFTYVFRDKSAIFKYQTSLSPRHFLVNKFQLERTSLQLSQRQSLAPRRSLDFANRNYEICYSEGVALADIKLKSEGPADGGGERSARALHFAPRAVNTEEERASFFPAMPCITRAL
jgi:hypothetical protein